MAQKPNVYSFSSFNRRFSRQSAAFSIIEIMVVVSIIGLLIAIGTAVSVRMSQQARVEQVRSMMEGLLGANEEFKAVRKQGAINHTGGYPIDWTAGAGPNYTSSERFAVACMQVKTAETMMMTAINSGPSKSLDRIYRDANNNGIKAIYDRWGTEIEYRAFNDGSGSGPGTEAGGNIANSDLPLSQSPFFVSAGPDKTFRTDDDITTIQNPAYN